MFISELSSKFGWWLLWWPGRRSCWPHREARLEKQVLLTKRFVRSTLNLLLRKAQVELMARTVVKEQVEAPLAQVVSREKQVLLTKRFQSHAVVRSMLDLLLVVQVFLFFLLNFFLLARKAPNIKLCTSVMMKDILFCTELAGASEYRTRETIALPTEQRRRWTHCTDMAWHTNFCLMVMIGSCISSAWDMSRESSTNEEYLEKKKNI